MIKKYLPRILFIVYSLLFVPAAQAVSPTPEDTTTEIRDQLITNIASRVAQLKLVEKRGIVGKVSDSTNTQITITDFQDNIRFVDVDELTKFLNPSANGTFGISDITKGSTVGILGLYNKESRRILARFVNVITIPTIIHGGVIGIDNKNYTLSVTTEEKKQITVDVERLTRTYEYSQKGGLIRSGFSKIKENSSIIITGIPNKTDENTLTAARIIFFPEIPSSPKISSTLENSQKSE